MSNITITNVEPSKVVVKRGEFEHSNVVTLAGAPAGNVLKEGTILARSTSTGKFIPYEKGGSTDGNGVPQAVLIYDVPADAAGDFAIDAMISGVVKKFKLIILADGDASNVDASVTDLMKDKGLTVVEVKDNSVLDNQ